MKKQKVEKKQMKNLMQLSIKSQNETRKRKKSLVKQEQ
jgi:hypothetical protein